MDATHRRLLCRAAAAAAAGRAEVLSAAYVEARDAGVPPDVLQEATLQVFLFAGYPRAILAFEELARVFPAAPSPPQETFSGDFEERGFTVFRRVYDFQAGRVLERLRSLHPDLARFVIRDAYGMVLGRPFLDLAVRELLAVAMLAALLLPNQLKAHVRGAVHAGAKPEWIRDAASAARDVLSADDWARAEVLVREQLG